MRDPDVIVVGTGRSGTSTVARLLHTELGVCMGHKFRDNNASNPKGEYEDTDIALASRRLVGGFPFPDAPVELDGVLLARWRTVYETSHRRCKSKLRGVKSPHLSALDVATWEKIKPRLIIRTWRPRDEVVASMKKWRGVQHDWGAFYDQREAQMKETLRALDIKTIYLSFAETRHDNELLSWLRPEVNRL